MKVTLRGGGEDMSDRALRVAAPSEKEKGQALAEYGLILAFIAAACVLALGALGLALAGQLDAVTAVFP
jgi:Flp pilus assembly pilin Flp